MAIYPWIQSAAEEIHDQLDSIEGEAGQAAQVEQDMEAGFFVWRERVMAIILKNFLEYSKWDAN